MRSVSVSLCNGTQTEKRAFSQAVNETESARERARARERERERREGGREKNFNDICYQSEERARGNDDSFRGCGGVVWCVSWQAVCHVLPPKLSNASGSHCAYFNSGWWSVREGLGGGNAYMLLESK